MYNRIKKSMPTGILTVGTAISVLLMILAHLTGKGTFSYQSFVLIEQLQEAAGVIFAECLMSAIIFKIFLKKEKSSDRDFQQKD